MNDITTLTLTLALGVALALLAVVVNHIYARLAVVELALNEGLPPGHEKLATTVADAPSIDVALAVGQGVHLFLSRSCHACQRLIDELDQTDLSITADLHIRYLDRARPIATSAAKRHQATLHEHQLELSTQLQVNPLPFTIAVGDHDLVSGAVTPSLDQVLVAARDAGIDAVRT